MGTKNTKIYFYALQKKNNFNTFFFLRYLQLLSIVPDDVGVLQKLGDIYENINDKQQAYHYYYEV